MELIADVICDWEHLGDNCGETSQFSGVQTNVLSVGGSRKAI